jgi:hypothetical protein
VTSFAEEGQTAEAWIEARIGAARQGNVTRFTTYAVESATSDLPPHFYREDEDTRSVKRDLGLRRAINQPLPGTTPPAPKRDTANAVRHLSQVVRESREPVLQSAARSLKEYLK